MDTLMGGMSMPMSIVLTHEVRRPLATIAKLVSLGGDALPCWIAHSPHGMRAATCIQGHEMIELGVLHGMPHGVRGMHGPFHLP